ncbi:restriction endonuclease subunit S [Limosilactobacillus fermentum]|uniref:restriction endonuclease subunit S n=1 Tax=Limosilactobacillus fermentum TaxID=1613 RepID=UPI00124BB33E|nr:restriction endonuclease subunit S [Limosilactobacillus fermentum]KAB1962173.1 restriction endonuclease subunit S [Limosilactobacillus fermentum]
MKDNQAKYPQLRFKGFTGPWEKRSLDEITTKTKSYSLSRDVERDHETGYRYIHYGDIHTGVADIVTEHTNLPNIEPANYDELRVNDLVVADASEDYQGIAEPAVVVGLPTQHLVAGLHTIALRPSSASSLYLYYLLHTESFKHFGYQTGTGLKVFGISWSNLSKFTFMIPSRPEQEKIVKLIESVDNLTSDNQRKLAKLKELKQGYLQKLFPQNGSKFPQLRFAGFADAWEQRKLSDLTESHNSGVYIPKDQYGEGTNIIGVGDIYDSDVVDGQRYRLAPVKDKRFILHTNDLLYGESSLVPEGIARVVSVSEAGAGTAFAWHTRRFKVNQVTLNSRFLGLELDCWLPARSHLMRSSTKTALTGITTQDFFNTQIVFPSKPEQEKIATLINSLDTAIALHQRKLEKLQELKKGYLQKMFC